MADPRYVYSAKCIDCGAVFTVEPWSVSLDGMQVTVETDAGAQDRSVHCVILRVTSACMRCSNIRTVVDRV